LKSGFTGNSEDGQVVNCFLVSWW